MDIPVLLYKKCKCSIEIHFGQAKKPGTFLVFFRCVRKKTRNVPGFLDDLDIFEMRGGIGDKIDLHPERMLKVFERGLVFEDLIHYCGV